MIDDPLSQKHEEQIAFKNLYFMIKLMLFNICTRENRGQHIPILDQGPKTSMNETNSTALHPLQETNW